MKRLITISCAALALGVVLASVPCFAQGPAGLNSGAGGPGFPPWAGPANNFSNPISGSPQDPGMQHRPLGVPAR